MALPPFFALYTGVVAASGHDVPVTYAPRRAGDMRRVFFKSSKAERELGWRDETELDAGIAATLAYFRERQLLHA